MKTLPVKFKACKLDKKFRYETFSDLKNPDPVFTGRAV